MAKVQSKKPEGKKVFRKDIQALRAFAVMSVVLYHLWPERMVGGFAGVDIFFVISGYLMTISIMRRLKPLADERNITTRSVASLLANFYAHRIRRLVPAALSTLAGILILAQLTGNLNVIITNAKNVLSAATFWQNWLLANDSVNYLQQDNAVVASQHFWSLSVEEQFYLIWPLLLVVCTLLTINIVVLFKRSKIPGIILPITLATLGSIAYGIWLTHSDQTVAYYSTPARVWELMLGGVIALLPIVKNYDLKLMLPYAGLVVCLYSIFFIGTDGFPGWLALIPTIGTALIVMAGTDRAASPLAFDRIFSWRPIQWIGNISYSIYLWHFPLIILLPILLHRDIDGPHSRLFKVGIIILSLVLAQLSYKFIEQSTQHIQLKVRYIFIFFVIATGVVVGASYAIQHHTENQIDANLKSMHTAALDENNICFGARAILHQDKCGDPYGHSNQTYAQLGSLDSYLNILSEQRGCKKTTYGKMTTKTTDDYCTFGDAKAKKVIILIGDSHASHYVNAFDAIGKKYHYRVDNLISQLCVTDWKTMVKTPLCQKQWEFFQNHIKEIHKKNPQSFVVVSTLWASYYDISNLVESMNVPDTMQHILIKDEPRAPEGAIDACYTIGVRCQYDRETATKDVRSIVEKLSENNVTDGWNILNNDNAFCDKKYCYGYIGGIPLFRNSIGSTVGHNLINSHMDGSYSYSLAPFVAQKLDLLN